MVRQRARSGWRPKIEGHAAFLLKAIGQRPDATLAEMLATRDVDTSIATLRRFCAWHGIPREKRPDAMEQDRPNVLKRREERFEG